MPCAGEDAAATTTPAALDAAIRAAHARGDCAALARHYARAADAAGDEDAAGFLRTHAYVFALEAGDPIAGALRERLRRDGREE